MKSTVTQTFEHLSDFEAVVEVIRLMQKRTQFMNLQLVDDLWRLVA